MEGKRQSEIMKLIKRSFIFSMNMLHEAQTIYEAEHGRNSILCQKVFQSFCLKRKTQILENRFVHLFHYSLMHPYWFYFTFIAGSQLKSVFREV